MLDKAEYDSFSDRSSLRPSVAACIIVLCLVVFQVLHGDETLRDEYESLPLSTALHNIGMNTVNSITYNYGLNFAGAVAGTALFIETKLDWKWRNIVYDNPWVSAIGLPGLYIGYTVPVITPFAAYAIGRFIKDERLQITGLALMQSLLLTLAIQSPLKVLTGRSSPKITSVLDHKRGVQTNDFSNEFNWFNFNFIAGWPSGHTATAFSAAATVATIYEDKPLLKTALYAYAFFIGISVTLDVHWLSEAFSGALIGYAIGKTVGKEFKNLLNNIKEKNKLTLYFTPNFIGFRIKI